VPEFPVNASFEISSCPPEWNCYPGERDFTCQGDTNPLSWTTITCWGPSSTPLPEDVTAQFVLTDSQGQTTPAANWTWTCVAP
jgi:hypothetical protein